MIRTKLRDYQEEAVDLAMGHDGFLIYAEQRTGKCLISLSVVDRRKPKHLWIVCPIGAFKVWKAQIAEHLEVDWDCNFVMINYEELIAKSDLYYKLASKIKDEGLMIIGDEIHKIKKRGTAQSGCLRILARRARWRLGLTGTPLGQGLEDSWAQFDFVDKSVFGPFSTRIDKKTGEITQLGFEDKYILYGGFMGKKAVGYCNQAEFYEKFHSRSFRVTLREAREKPLSIVHRKIWVELSHETRELYDELEEKMIIEVNKKKVKVPIVIALLTKLQQITGGYVIDSEERQPHLVGTEKWRALVPILEDLHREGRKFVIVCRFLHEIRFLEAKLAFKRITTKRVAGGFPYDGKFDVDCVLIQVQSGVAVDMSAADHIYFYSSDYSYLNFEQMKSRILNYTKPWASFHYLLARATIDELIYYAVTRKKNVAHLVLDKYRMQKDGRQSRIEAGRGRVRNAGWRSRGRH